MTIRVAVVGTGNIGKNHARCYQADDRSELVAVCDLVPEVAKKAGEAFEVPWYGSVADLLAANLEIDAVSVCTAGVENGGDHYAPTMELLRAGVPVLGEKPISNRVEEAKEMVALATEMGIPYAINLNHRFTPAARRAREWLDEGRIGEVNICNMTMWINNPNESSPHFHMRPFTPIRSTSCAISAGTWTRSKPSSRKDRGDKSGPTCRQICNSGRARSGT